MDVCLFSEAKEGGEFVAYDIKFITYMIGVSIFVVS